MKQWKWNTSNQETIDNIHNTRMRRKKERKKERKYSSNCDY